MKRVLIINGSYRSEGATDQMVAIAQNELVSAGAEVDTVMLRDYPIKFCLNCRHCTQHLGNAPGECVHDDNMTKLIDKIEQSDALVLASPTNFGSVTAIFQRFIERLTVYGYWPWGQPAPKMRREVSKRENAKKAMLISSSAAPSFMARWAFHTRKQLKLTARVIGASVVGSVHAGMMSQPQAEVVVSRRLKTKIQRLSHKLIEN